MSNSRSSRNTCSREEGEEGESLTSIKEVKSREVKITLVALPAIFPRRVGRVGRGGGREGGRCEWGGERQTGQPLIAAIKSIEQDWHVACPPSFPLFKHIWVCTGAQIAVGEIRSSSRNGVTRRESCERFFHFEKILLPFFFFILDIFNFLRRDVCRIL